MWTNFIAQNGETEPHNWFACWWKTPIMWLVERRKKNIERAVHGIKAEDVTPQFHIAWAFEYHSFHLLPLGCKKHEMRHGMSRSLVGLTVTSGLFFSSPDWRPYFWSSTKILGATYSMAHVLFPTIRMTYYELYIICYISYISAFIPPSYPFLFQYENRLSLLSGCPDNIFKG